MNIFLKIICAPIVAALAAFGWVAAGILKLSAWVFALLGTVFLILGLITLFAIDTQNGIIILISAFLVSPLGLPMLAAWLTAQTQSVRYAIQYAVYK